jgi:hypothetical protein
LDLQAALQGDDTAAAPAAILMSGAKRRELLRSISMEPIKKLQVDSRTENIRKRIEIEKL